MIKISSSDINTFTNKFLSENINKLLADDSYNYSYLKILLSAQFKPQSFTIGDRQSSKIYLEESEKDFNKWLTFLIEDYLERISIN